MTRVDFYVLGAGAPAGRENLACRIAEKGFTQSHKVYVHAASAADAGRMDELLWTFRDVSFVPHALADTHGGDEPPAVLIGHPGTTAEVETFLDADDSDAGRADDTLLVNLSEEVPAFFDRFARVAELVDGDDERRRLGRERFRFYRDRGCPLETHRL